MSGLFRRFRRSGKSPSTPIGSKKESFGELDPLGSRALLSVILARGGTGQIEGDVALMDVGGVSMAARVSFAVSQLGDVLVVGRPGTLAGVAAVPFYRKDSHTSLTGLVTGMRAALDLSSPGTKPMVLLVGVDQPYVRVETLRFLLAFAGANEAVVPVDEAGARQVTCAVYPSSWFDRAERADDDDQSLEAFLETVKVREIASETWKGWGEDGRSWFRVAAGESLEEARRRFDS
ncbi:MAG: NTP transferase domain-containing protein [Acidimicrobiia bacterium]|nr:NTP transferase domain-containing protein [Acidimicrobiia bacterium]